MKCLIPGINVKVLARAIHALSKVGDELYIEPLPEGISFRTVNCARSAYASFNFAPSFFINYSSGNIVAAVERDDDDNVKCKVAMKSCTAVFRSPNNIDKQVETCMLRFDPDDDKLILQFQCRYGIIKNHNLPIIECETLQAVYTKDLAPNVLIAEPKLLVDALHHFQYNQDELTFAVTPSKIVIRNFTDLNEPQKVIRTELCLEPGEFVQYKVRGDTTITFCLREFRALLSFAESVMLPIAINFETSGRPAVFVITHPHTFEVNLVLATLMPQGDSQQVLTPHSMYDLSNKRSSSSHYPTSSRGMSKRAKFTGAPQNPSTSRAAMMRKSCNGTSVKKKSDLEGNAQKNSVSDQSGVLDGLGEEFDMEWDNVNDEIETSQATKSNPKMTKDTNENSVCGERNRVMEDQPRISTMTPPSQDLSNISKQKESDITGTHLSSVSVVYRRCFQDTFNPNDLPGYDEILAPDSDEEPD